MQSRTFGAVPKNVIWIQLPGFEVEHAALIRFGGSDSRRLSAIEDMECAGSAWSYNYYDIRTNALDSTLSQLTGSPDIKNSCAGEDRYPVWQYYRALGFSTYGIELGTTSKTSLTTHLNCGQGKFLDGFTWLAMRANPAKNNEPMFHYQSNKILEDGKINWDQTCQGKDGKCFATLLGNVRAMWENLSSQNKGTFLLIRNFDYLSNLKKGNIQLARESLSEVDKVIRFFREQPNSDQTLILVTGGETVSLRMPERGKEWAEFEKRGKNVLNERTKLLSPVLARGPSAENFCGVYEESRILYRQFWRQNQTEFSLKSIIE